MIYWNKLKIDIEKSPSGNRTQVNSAAIKQLNESLQKKQLALSIFVIYVITLIAVYDLIVEVIMVYHDTHKTSNTIISSIGIFVYSVVLFRMIKKMHYPLSVFGFNLRHLKKQIIESVTWSVIFCVALLYLKWILINHVPFFQSEPLFHPFDGLNWKWHLALAGIYMLFAGLQCFIIQGAIQSSLMKFLSVPKSVVVSIALSTLIFSSFHIEMHFIFALLTLAPGLLWAIMYARHRSLVGVWISHAIIGFWAFWGLGLFHMIERVYIPWIELRGH